jgi:glycosyltransferase involved in cell wall biosynthesis
VLSHGLMAGDRTGSLAPTVSVVIPTYNRAAGLEQVVRPVLADPAAHELVVVVDGSRDGSIELLEEIARDEPRLRPMLIENKGEMAAREAGARAATGDVVLFLDDDVVATAGLVAGHARHHAEPGRRVVVGYMPVEPPARRTPGDFAQRLYAREYENRCAIYERDPANVLHNFWAGNISMRRDDVLRVGMDNPDFGERYHPDRDFGIRLMEAGLTGVFDRSLRARHLYDRPLAAFARDSRSQVAARALMHGLHPDVVPAVDLAEFQAGLPGAAKRVVRAAARPRVHSIATGLLRRSVAAAGAVHAWPLQDAAAKLLRRIEQQRGAIELAAGRRG